MSDEEDLESQSVDTVPISNGFSICDYDDTDDTEPALAIGVEKTKDSPKAIAAMNRRSEHHTSREDLDKIQDLVSEMKQGFSQALNELSKIQYSDQALEVKLNEHKADYQKQLTHVLQMILSLKSPPIGGLPWHDESDSTEFGTPLGQIKVALEEHKVLKRQVDALRRENALLMAELERNGTISEGVRKRLSNSPLSHSTSLPDSAIVTPPNGRSVSDRDSGVTTYQNDSTSTTGERSPEVAQITPMVHNYIDNLHTPGVERLEDSDSDNSVTAVANKSIDLSRSLVDKCLVESDDDQDYEPSSHQHQRHHYDRDSLDRRQSMPSPTSVISSPFSRKTAPHELAYRDKQRSKVAHELVETERKYCSCLWTMVDFLAESLKSASVVSAREVKLMFPVALSSMYDFHADILKRFEERINNWKLHAIVGDIFARMTDPNSDFLLLYQTYVNDFQTSLQTIRKCTKQSHKFRKLLMTLQIHPVCDGLDLSAFLLTPIQRIPRYVLLIKTMLLYTETDHPDHYYLETTLEKMKTFLDQLNSSIESGLPMDQYSYVADNRSLPSRRRHSSPLETTESETGSDVTRSLDGDTSIRSLSARKFAHFKRSWGRLSQSLANPRTKLQTPRTDMLPKSLPRTKLFNQNVTLPRQRRHRSRTERPMSMCDKMAESNLDSSFQEFSKPKRCKSQSNIMDESPRQRDSLSKSVVEADLIDKLIANKANARSLPSVTQIGEEEPLSLWQEPQKMNSTVQTEKKKRGGFFRDSLKNIFSRKSSSAKEASESALWKMKKFRLWKSLDVAPRTPTFNNSPPPDLPSTSSAEDGRYQFPAGDDALTTSLLEDEMAPCSAV